MESGFLVYFQGNESAKTVEVDYHVNVGVDPVKANSTTVLFKAGDFATNESESTILPLSKMPQFSGKWFIIREMVDNFSGPVPVVPRIRVCRIDANCLKNSVTNL